MKFTTKMKKLIFTILLIGPLVGKLLASDESGGNTVYLSGKISSNTDSVHLMLGYWANFITGSGNEFQVNRIGMNPDGSFHAKIPAPNHPFRVQLADALSTSFLFGSEQIAEPGDSVYVVAQLRDQEEYSEENFKGAFVGRGSGKYNCVQALKLVSDEPLRFVNNTKVEARRIADSLIQVKEGILEKFKGDMSPLVYQIIKADIIGNIKYTYLRVPRKDSNHDSLMEPVTGDSSFLSGIINIPDDVLALSTGYVNFTYEKLKIEATTITTGREANITDLFDLIRGKYSGKLREILLANCLLNNLDVTSRFQVDCETYTHCLKDAITITKTDWIKAPLETALYSRGKGAKAYNFKLPVDSSGKFMMLADLKDKVVLLDMWGFICTGCYRFSNAFHQKIYPLFKDNPDFAIVSIMLDDNAGRQQYMQRLRGEKGPRYTFPEYINLYGGKGQDDARQMEEHYNVRSMPFILLIDRKGEIFSSTVPFVDNPKSANVEKLIALIQKALNNQ